ncbi:MAG: efflux RND transporter periplasmic adaptor subunit [Chitinophagales bacterium]|nr:HlyD family efflux transporter periplasmic adaptor subunit [Bacteroidota bacterium]MCB9042247.1 HlyD family efflux transporter periplasmic adaptor subunit [Chitinophagales bacterium]
MKRILIWATVLFFLLASVGLMYYFYQKSKKIPENYEILHAAKRDIVQKTLATGSIVPEKEVAIIPRVSGIVEKIFVEPGQNVQVGQEIAKIKLVPDALSLNRAQAELSQAKIALDNARKELQRQENMTQNGELTQQAKLNFEQAQKDWQRYQQLYTEKLISEQEYLQYKNAFDIAKNAYDVSQTTTNRSLSTYQNELDLAQSRYETAQNNLQLLKEGATKNVQQVSNVVRATVTGTVLEVPVKEGTSVIESNTFNAGTTIASIADLKDMIFKGKIDESEVGKLKLGMDLILTIGAIQDKKYNAKLTYIAPKGIEEEGTIKFDIEATLDLSPEDFIRAGYSANADIVLEQKKDVLAIEESVVEMKNDSSWVWVETAPQEFEKKLIKTGLSDGIYIEIKDGLSENDKVKLAKE